MRIYVTEHGRLGNQILQYYLLRTWFPKDRICFFGFEDLEKTFDLENVLFIPNRIHYWWGMHRKIQWVRLLYRLRLISEIRVHGSELVTIEKGLFGGFAYLSLDALLFPNQLSLSQFRFNGKTKQSVRKTADDFLNTVNASAEITAFLHVRRGDYVFWPNKQYPAVLPLSWYRTAITALLEQQPEIEVLVILTDDLPYVEDIKDELLSDLPLRSEVSTLGLAEDLCIMQQLPYGILSGSTFSWCAVHLGAIERRLSQAVPKELFIAPKYWHNYRLGQWPEVASLRSDLLQYMT